MPPAAALGQQVGDPHKAAPAVAIVQDLHRGIVMSETTGSDYRPNEPSRVIVDIDNELIRDQTVDERDDPRTVLETGIDKETWRKTLMRCPDVANGRPDVFRGSLNDHFPPNGCHVDLPFRFGTIVLLRC